MILNGSNNAGATNPGAPPAAVSADTTTRVSRDTARQVGVAHNGRAPRGIDPARAADSLNRLVDQLDSLGGTALRNAAVEIYYTIGVSDKDKALAAYLAANGYAKMDEVSSTCTWARRAVTLDRSSRAYAALQQSTCGS
jgi:hypothetical protein